MRSGESASAPAVRPAFAVAGVGAIVALTLAHPSSSRLLTWPLVLVASAFWVMPVVLVVLRLGGRAAFHVPNRLVTAGLGLLALATVISAALSPFSAASFVRTWPTLGGVAFFFLLHDWFVRRPPREAALAQTVAIAGAVVVAASAIAWVSMAPNSPWTLRNAYPFGHSNYTGGFIVLVFPWLAHRAWTTRGGARIAWLLAIAITMFALAGTSSRGAVLALVAAGGGVAWVILVRASWSRGRKFALVVALAAGGAIAILANPRLRDLVVRRGWSDDAQESNRQRSSMLHAGAMLGAERPAFGWGPGTVPLVYPRVRAALEGGVDNVLELHNTPVQVWATLGLAGVAASVLIFVGGIAAGRRGFADPLRAVAATSLGAYAIFVLTDHQLDLPAISALVALNLALLTAAVDRCPFSASPRRTLVAGAVVLLAALPLFALLRDLQARRTYDRALSALEDEQPLDALQALDAATRQTPHDPWFQHQAVGILLAMRDAVPDPARRERLTRDAIARLETSLATGVHQEFAHFNLGWLHLETGNVAAAARNFVSAARLVPDKGGVYLGLGLALQAAGRSADATRAFALEWINDPRSQTSPAWEVPALAALRPAIRVEVTRLYGELAPKYPRAAVASAWTRWWQGELVTAEELGRGFTRDAADFAAALPAIAARQPVTSSATWTILYNAWRERRFPFPAVSDHAAGEAAMGRRAQRHGDDFSAFLRAGSDDEAGLLRVYRRSRKGYGVLAFHPDGPPLTDAYIVQEIGLATDFGATLFPPKGWLPGRFLLALLPLDPR